MRHLSLPTEAERRRDALATSMWICAAIIAGIALNLLSLAQAGLIG